jgi:hypothetical protein
MISRSCGVIRGLAPTIGLLSVLVPATVHAQQTNLDQGKSASQIFSGACAECHKAAHGLARGKSADTVAEFLREHYTTSRDQAAALAAYVVGGRDTVAAPLPGRKPPTEHAAAPTEESKPGKRQKPAKPEEGASASVKPQRPRDAEAKRKEEEGAGEIPGVVNPIIRFDGTRPAASLKNRRKEPKAPESQEPGAVAHEPAAIMADPAKSETPSQEAPPMPSAAVPADAGPNESGEGSPLPRDNVPD